MLQFKLKLIATSIMAVLLLVIFVLELFVFGHADESQIERLIEKAGAISENFSFALTCEEIIGTESKQDYFSKEEIKVIKFRASPQTVLEVRYGSENEILSAEVVNNISVEKALKCVTIFMLFIIFIVSLFSQLCDYDDSNNVNAC